MSQPDTLRTAKLLRMHHHHQVFHNRSPRNQWLPDFTFQRAEHSSSNDFWRQPRISSPPLWHCVSHPLCKDEPNHRQMALISDGQELEWLRDCNYWMHLAFYEDYLPVFLPIRHASARSVPSDRATLRRPPSIQTPRDIWYGGGLCHPRVQLQGMSSLKQADDANTVERINVPGQGRAGLTRAFECIVQMYVNGLLSCQVATIGLCSPIFWPSQIHETCNRPEIG